MSMWWQKKTREKIEMAELEKKLRAVSRPALDPVAKAEVRDRLLKMIKVPAEERGVFQLYHLGQRLNQVARRVELPPAARVFMKEKLLAFIEKTAMLGFAFGKKQRRYFREFLSAALLFCFIVTAVFFLPLHKIPVTFAHETYIQEFSGEVSILRNGRVYPAQKDFSLQEGDILLTGSNSLASVHFLDDSTSRLGQDGHLQLKKLYSQPENPVLTQVEVLLGKGRLWTRVLNLVDEHSRFVVDSDKMRAVVTKKAAFDMDVQPTKAVLTVFDNVVGLSAKNSSSDQKPILAGFQAEVASDSTTKKTTVVAIDQKSYLAEHNWFTTNLQQDQSNDQKLVAEKVDSLEVHSGLKTGEAKLSQPVRENNIDSQSLADPELEVQRLNFLQNYHSLELGESLLTHPQQAKDGMGLVLQFHDVATNLLTRLPDLEKKSPEGPKLRVFIQTKIAKQRKDLATFLPGDDLYPAKKVIEETQLFLAHSEVDRTLMRLSQTEDALFELQDLVRAGKIEQGTKILNLYKTGIDQFVLKINDDNLDEFKQKTAELFKHQFEQIKILTGIEKSLQSLLPQQQNFLFAVRKVRTELLQKFIASLAILPQSVPRQVIADLKDLLQTYMVQADRDQFFIELLNKLLVSRGAGTAGSPGSSGSGDEKPQN